MTERLCCWGSFGPWDENKWDMPLRLATLHFDSSFFVQKYHWSPQDMDQDIHNLSPLDSANWFSFIFSPLGSDPLTFFKA